MFYVIVDLISHYILNYIDAVMPLWGGRNGEPGLGKKRLEVSED